MISDAELASIVKEMRKKVDSVKMIEDENDTLKKSAMCRKFLGPTQWGPLLEKHIKEKFNIGRCLDSTSGDGLTINNKRVEIKVSLGGDTGGFNFVQLRPDHKIDYYLFLAYNLHEGDFGKLHWFLCEPTQLYKLLPEFAGYSHGTQAKFGKISKENIYGRNCEYSLRPNPNKSLKNKSRKLWNLLIQKFAIKEAEITQNLSVQEY